MDDDEGRRRFEQLYDETYPALLGYARRRAGQYDDAADVVAETFLTAWRRLDDVPAGDAARPWLFGVARNVLANQRRGDRRRGALADRLSDQPVDRPPFDQPPLAHAEGDRPESDPRIIEALRRLPEADQEVLTLVAWEGLDRPELAIALGCSRATARVRLHRARRRLHRELGADVDTGPAVAAEPGPEPDTDTRTEFARLGTPARLDGQEAS